MDVLMVHMLSVGSAKPHTPSVNADPLSVNQSTKTVLRELKGHGTTGGTSSTPRRLWETGSNLGFNLHDDRTPPDNTRTCLRVAAPLN